MHASRDGQTSIVRLLLENGADYRLVDKDGWTALIRASRAGHLESVRLLLNFGSDMIDAVDRDGWSALMHSAHNGHKEIIKLLIESGADKEIEGKEKETALNVAFDEATRECIRNTSATCMNFYMK